MRKKFLQRKVVHILLIYLKKGDKEKARMEYEKVLQLDPRYHEALKILNQIVQGKKE